MQGKIAAGIVTLYDALIFALRWYLLLPDHRDRLKIDDSLDLMDEKAMIAFLRDAGVIDDAFDLEAFEGLVDKAENDEMPDFDYKPMLARFELLMTKLAVMPFDEKQLPPEDPATF